MSRPERSESPSLFQPCAEAEPSVALSNVNPCSPSVMIAKPATKLCHIVKRPDFEGYGFNLHSEKLKPGQFIGKIDENSPAELAGLKEGDRIIEVNGVSIGRETHKQVVQRIKAISCDVRLLLVDVNATTISPNDLGNPVQPTSLSEGKEEKVTNGTQTASDIKYRGTVQELPGESANISSISLISTKRISNGNYIENDIVDVIHHTGMDLPLKSLSTNSTVCSNQIFPQKPKHTLQSSAQNLQSLESNEQNIVLKAGSLQLPTTAAEMRAKLLSRKKYDPKNDVVDLKQKYEIIQKL